MTERKNKMEEITSCGSQCPVHGTLSARGRSFQGTVVKKIDKRVTIVFDRTIYVRKYDRYSKAKTKLHARLPNCMNADINVGDYIEIRECRPLSKIIHFVVIHKIREAEK